MREIEFRGKRKSEMPGLDGEWVYGSLYHAKFWKTGNVLYRITPYDDNGESYHVDPETIGQYTGLKDRNGVKIFEGDVVKSDSTGMAGDVYWIKEHASFYWGTGQSLIHYDELEVIGNIHDKAELLEAGDTETFQ